ncbi:MAG: hypothetical protein M1587_01350, partial [Thaumarchaeota archaeon]|nr:hypothetical protein [Nitrososphaerota archaeon]
QKRYLAPKVYPSTVKSEDYDRNIHCVEVPNHTLLVRRNGKIVWSGNSWELASDLLKADGGKHPEVVRYAVGEGASLEFEGWWRLREKIPDPEQLFRKPTETEVPNEISLQLVVATLIVEKITSLISKKSAEQKLFEALDVACILASRLPPEVQTICLKMLVSSNNGIPAILFKCPNWKPLGSRLAKYVLP